MKNKILSVILLVSILLMFCVGCQNKNESNSEPYGIHHAIITVENYGDIHLELDGDTAPITVKNFVELAKDGFYNGLTIHRVVSGFVIQGGDPKADGTGGSGKTIKGEFTENGVENNILHKRGVISMARLGNDFNSATSQFFIVLQDAETLDGLYASFGHVTQGMDIVDKIAKETKVADYQSGLVSKSNQPIIKSIVILD